MSEQHILSAEEENDLARRLAAEREARTHGICCCENSGEPFEFGGVMVVMRNAGCRVHRPERKLYHPVDAAEPLRIGQGQRRYDR